MRGGETSGSKRERSPSSTAAAVKDNSVLSAKELEKATQTAFFSARSYRALVTLKPMGGALRFLVEVAGPSRYRGRGEAAGIEAILNRSGTTYIRFGAWAGLAPEVRALLDGPLRDRWVVSARGIDIVDNLRWIDRVLRHYLVGGGSESGGGDPVLGEERSVDGTPTVAYRYPSGVEVRVPRTGAPLPMVIESPDLTVRYRDFGADLTIDIPHVEQTVSYRDLFES